MHRNNAWYIRIDKWFSIKHINFKFLQVLIIKKEDASSSVFNCECSSTGDLVAEADLLQVESTRFSTSRRHISVWIVARRRIKQDQISGCRLVLQTLQRPRTGSWLLLVFQRESAPLGPESDQKRDNQGLFIIPRSLTLQKQARRSSLGKVSLEFI
jgi:hypothetical protein